MVRQSARLLTVTRILFLFISVCVLASGASADDWPELRGPDRTGVSAEQDLPETWSLDGENLLWRVPYGGLSGPVVLGDRVYLQNSMGEGASIQERILAFDANTGELVWEDRLNITHSDAPGAPGRMGHAGTRSGNGQRLYPDGRCDVRGLLS